MPAAPRKPKRRRNEHHCAAHLPRFRATGVDLDVAVATHKTIDLVVQTQVKKVQRNMRG